jgi:adenylate kinase family enzyme
VETSDALKSCSRGEEAKGYMRRGDIVPFDLVVTALREGVAKLADGQVALFGGFPRDPEQGALAVTLRLPVCHLDTDLATCVARAHARMAEAKAGQADFVRGDREDELDVDVLIRRFGLYAFRTLPALQQCAEAGILRVITGGSEPHERGLQLVRMLGLA